MQRSSSILCLALSIALFAAADVYGQANTFPCPADITGAELVPVPEIESKDGVLSGTLYTVSEQQRRTSQTGGTGTPNCFPQWVRAYRRSAPATWNPTSQQLTVPQPGPTLRARLGDVVNLTFLNVIDPTKFPGVDDDRCDETSVYPGQRSATNPNPDQYPDCFAGSVYTNVHYHGTHTNPNTTGDNVFLVVRPSPRNADGSPVVSAQSVKPAFDEFFTACRQELKANTPKIWPRIWSDLPETLQSTLSAPLKQYTPAWWTANQKLIANGDWPQYYVGAYPYCFKIPELTTASATPASPEARTAHTHGAGEAEVDEAKAPQRPLLMGQAPGTHWYHAHKHGSTTINVANGMTGVFVIEGEYDDVLKKYYDTPARPWKPQVLVVQQLSNAPGLMTGTGGAPGGDFFVNGQLRPVISVPGNSVQMWRIANTAGRAGIYFPAPAPPNDLQWKQLAQDGVQFNDANYQAHQNQPFLLASGNRADLLVKVPAYRPDGRNTYDLLVFDTIDPIDRPPLKPNVKPFPLLTVKVTANTTPAMQFIPNAPPFPGFLADIRDEEISGTKVIRFASSAVAIPNTFLPSQHTIDGKKFDGEVGVVVGLNHAEEWKVVNETYPPANSNQISHPFHIHINPFQVTEVFDPNATLSSKTGPGTIAVTGDTTSNTSTITGTGTEFDTTFRVGDWLWINTTSDKEPAIGPSMITGISGPTSMTIANIPGRPRTISAATYRAVVPLYTIDKINARPGQCVLDPKDPRTWKPCGETVPAEDRIWWDVFSIPSGSTFTADGKTTYKIPGYFKMRSRFVDYSGYYVIHCHILAHEDRGMMTVVEVAPLQTPYSHH